MTKRTALYCVVLVYALILVFPFSQVTVAERAKKLARHTVVAASGTAAPAGGNFMSFFRAAANMRNQIAFDASLGGPSTTGVFVADRRRTSTIALGGNPDPSAANFAIVNSPFITSRGDVVFNANFGDTFSHDGRSIAPLVRNGDPAPGGGTLGRLTVPATAVPRAVA